jgi:hypothetical protein
MTDWGFNENGTTDESQGNDNELNGPKALRDYVKKLQAQNEDLNAKLTSFLEDQQKSKLASVFENLGVPQAASAYTGPADPKAAEEWAKSMQQIFGGNQGGTPPVADTTVPEVQAPATGAIPPSMQAHFERLSEAGQQGIPAGNFEAAQSAIGSASNAQELIAAFERMNRM